MLWLRTMERLQVFLILVFQHNFMVFSAWLILRLISINRCHLRRKKKNYLRWYADQFFVMLVLTILVNLTDHFLVAPGKYSCVVHGGH